MAQGVVHGQSYNIRFRYGTRANLEKTVANNLGIQGEPFYTTDGKQLFIHDGTRIQPVQTLDMALCVNDEVVCLNNEIVYIY